MTREALELDAMSLPHHPAGGDHAHPGFQAGRAALTQDQGARQAGRVAADYVGRHHLEVERLLEVEQFGQAAVLRFQFGHPGLARVELRDLFGEPLVFARDVDQHQVVTKDVTRAMSHARTGGLEGAQRFGNQALGPRERVALLDAAGEHVGRQQQQNAARQRHPVAP